MFVKLDDKTGCLSVEELLKAAKSCGAQFSEEADEVLTALDTSYAVSMPRTRLVTSASLVRGRIRRAGQQVQQMQVSYRDFVAALLERRISLERTALEVFSRFADKHKQNYRRVADCCPGCVRVTCGATIDSCCPWCEAGALD